MVQFDGPKAEKKGSKLSPLSWNCLKTIEIRGRLASKRKGDDRNEEYEPLISQNLGQEFSQDLNKALRRVKSTAGLLAISSLK